MKTGSRKKGDIANGFGRLEARLKAVAADDLTVPDKKKVKAHLMEEIRDMRVKKSFPYVLLPGRAGGGDFLPYGLKKLADIVRDTAGKVFVPDWARVMMKERVLEYAENRSSREAGFESFAGAWYRRASALAVLTVFAFTIVAVMPEKHAVTYAKATFLDDVNGEVFVKRNLEMMQAYPNMVLNEGDVVVSGGESYATIRFFDESVGRINEHTRVKIESLDHDLSRPVFSGVTVFLENGRLWAKVMKLSDKSEFRVETEDMSAGVESGAAFDVSVDSGATRVAVFENVVTVVPAGAEKAGSKAVVAGYRAEVSSAGAVMAGEGDVMPAVVGVKIEKMPRNEVFKPNNEWIASNLDNDREYALELIADKENLIGGGKADERAEVKGLLMPGTSDSDAKFEDAWKIFTEAEAMLVKGDKEGAAAGLEKFKAEMGVLSAELAGLAGSDPAAAASLRNSINQKISINLDELADFLPDNHLYKAKETLQETELMFADSDVVRAEIRLRQAGDILLEIQSLVSAGKPHLASSLLKRYQNMTNNITVDITEQNVREVKEKFTALIEGQLKHMQTLTAIENSIIYRDQNELKERVREIRNDTLLKFAGALGQMPELVPGEVAAEVGDLYSTYVAQSDADAAVLEPLMEGLAGEKPNGMKFINPDAPEVPNEMGIFIMVPLEGTADVKTRIGLWSNAADGEKSKNKAD